MDVGASCSQNITDPRLGGALLDALTAGHTAEHALAALVAQERTAAYRQLTVVDRFGGVASHSGVHTLGTHATAETAGAVAAGNLLAHADVPEAMVDAFGRAEGAFGDRLLRGLQAALAAGGEAGPVQSAGLLIVADVEWPVVDLRVDWHDDPIDQLACLWRLWEPQMRDYVTRGIDPSTAPAYGVAGE